MTLISLPFYYFIVEDPYIGHFQHSQYITDNICWITYLIHAMNEACPSLHSDFFETFALKNSNFESLDVSGQYWGDLGQKSVSC